MLDHFLIPIAPLLLTAAGLGACVALFYSLKKEIHRLEQRLTAGEVLRETETADAQSLIEELRAELRAAEERTAQLVPPAPINSGLNLNRRTQVIRMFRHGDDPEKIATKLGLPRNEVTLLLKVHNLAVLGSAACPDKNVLMVDPPQFGKDKPAPRRDSLLTS